MMQVAAMHSYGSISVFLLLLYLHRSPTLLQAVASTSIYIKVAETFDAL